ncbi:MAG: hypothetical protein IPJ14_12495 [Kineosporiaceae bacterium]|nr:hypothetical protein [Kineosporiaceae bacterium]MBK7623443.1 hypothetical protein [Kineosporiaceae bacterium]MBK8074015.1 hypothetical protein [Kineosporiaceae bacterium]
MRGWQVGVVGATLLGAGVVWGPAAWASVITPKPDGRIVSPALVIRADGTVMMADPTAPPMTAGSSTAETDPDADHTAPVAFTTSSPGATSQPSSGSTAVIIGDAASHAPPTSSTVTGVTSTSVARPTGQPTTSTAARPVGTTTYPTTRPTTGPTSTPAPQTIQPTRVRTVSSDDDDEDDDKSTSSRSTRNTDKDDD